MLEKMLPVLFGAVTLFTFVWFYLVSRLFNLLKTKQPATYKKMGSPTLFYNNSPKNNLLFLKFLWRSEYQGLNDPQLTRLSQFMTRYLTFFFALWSVFAAMILLVIIRHPLPH